MSTRILEQHEDWHAMDTGQRVDIDDMLEQAILYRLEQTQRGERQDLPARNARTPCEPR